MPCDQGIAGRKGAFVLVALLLLALASEELAMIRTQSLTFDEAADFYAGYAIWKTRDYGLNAAHPPLVKMLATIPLLDLSLRMPPLPHHHLEANLCGRDFVFDNGPKYDAQQLIWRGRLVTGVFVILLAVLTFCAAREMFGLLAGLFALALFVFDPNVLAHGMYMTTDVALSCLFFATIYALYRYQKEPTLARFVLTAAAAGLALATKHSAIVLAPAIALLVIVDLGTEPDRRARFSGQAWLLRRAGILAAMLAVALTTLWACYGFRYAARPAGLSLDHTLAQQLAPLPHIEARAVAFLVGLHALPEAWIWGFLDVQRITRSVPSYVLGRFYARGPWFYFPLVLAMKLTLGSLGMLALTLWALATRRLRISRELYFLAMPPALFLLAAVASHLTQGVRHLLPLWPFGCILAAAGLSALIRTHRRWIWPTAALLTLHAGSSLLAYPNYLSYSNELWGGPSRTYHYLADSNADWGQQLKATRAYLDQHKVADCWIAYFVEPIVMPAYYGIPCKRLPTAGSIDAGEQLPLPALIRGPVLISTGELYALDYEATALNPYVSFRDVKPSAVIQDGVLVFEGEFAVPQLSAVSHVQASATLLHLMRPAEALRQAQLAQALAPDDFRTEVEMGDALAANGKLGEARRQYQRALAVSEAMDGSGQRVWEPIVRKRLDQAGSVTPPPLLPADGPESCIE